MPTKFNPKAISLFVEATIIITILNVNDLTITNVKPLVGTAFATAGSEVVVLTGTNLGVKTATSLKARNFFTTSNN